MQCPNCGKENIDSAHFCGACGHKFEEQQVTEPVVQDVAEPEVQEVAETEVQQAPQLVEPQQQSTVAQPVLPAAEPVTPKKKSKLPVLLVILVLIAAISGAGYVFGREFVASLFKTPEERLVDGFFNSMEARSGEFYYVLELEELEIDSGDPESDKMLQDILGDMKVESSVIYDQKAREMEGTLNLKMMGTSLVKADYYLNDDYVIVDVPLLYDEPMYWELHALIDSIRTGMNDGTLESSLSMFGETPDAPLVSPIVPEDTYIDFELLDESFEDYKDLLDRDTFKSYDSIDWTPYKEVMIPYFEDAIDGMEESEFEMEFDSDVTYDGVRYEIDYNYEDNSDMVFELVEVLSEDENIRAFLEEVFTTWIERIIENEDYAMYALISSESMDDVDEWDSDYEDELMDQLDDILDNMDDAFDDLSDTIEDAKDDAYYSTDVDIDELMDALAITMTYDLDNAGYLRSQLMEIEGSIAEATGGMANMPVALKIDKIKIKSMTEFNNLDQEVDIDGIDKDDAIDVGSMDEEELAQFQDELGANLLSSIMSNPAFSEMLMGGF